MTRKSAQQIGITIVAIIYVPILIAGTLLLAASMIIKALALLIILEPKDAARELEPLKNAIRRKA